ALGRAVQDPRGPAPDHHGPRPAPLLPGRAAAAGQRDPRRDVAGGAPASADARLRALGGLAQEALPGHAGNHRAVAGLGARRAGLRRPGAAGLPVPGAVVDPAGPLDPPEDHPGGVDAPGGLLARFGVCPGCSAGPAGATVGARVAGAWAGLTAWLWRGWAVAF